MWVTVFAMERIIVENDLITVQHSSALSLPHHEISVDAVLTDPPYYDNVPYADYPTFHTFGSKELLVMCFQKYFFSRLLPKNEEIIMESVRHESSKEQKYFLRNNLNSFQEIWRVLMPGGIAVIVYAHKTTAGWETMLNGLIDAKFWLLRLHGPFTQNEKYVCEV